MQRMMAPQALETSRHSGRSETTARPQDGALQDLLLLQPGRLQEPGQSYGVAARVDGQAAELSAGHFRGMPPARGATLSGTRLSLQVSMAAMFRGVTKTWEAKGGNATPQQQADYDDLMGRLKAIQQAGVGRSRTEAEDPRPRPQGPRLLHGQQCT